ncbi:purine phosphorylase [Salinisphaera sp. Q1T1-3]|uniref:phosphorylase family protein n=1 Tax=Salinisphaera sp. Q1T1-3 TaxID=2321229 RepID=UPI000E75D3E9|nr:purine phosphorylase [Salinisphaera sp. Q1T1-3]RJS93969.1 purine phosphorylase [Salinisphaera sp. Q1T1-3]
MSQPAPDRIAFIAALPGEARALARLPALGSAYRLDGSRVILGGMGPTRAEAAARRAIDEGATGLVSWGVAAALSPAAAPGDLLLAGSIIDADGQRHCVDPAWRAAIASRVPPGLNAASVDIAETPVVLADARAKAALYSATGAIGCDMESGAIARVAAERGVPFLAVRAVLDDANMVLPSAARAAMDESGHLQPLALTRAMIGRPRRLHAELRGLKHLAVAFRAARTTLAALAPAFDREAAA